MGEADFYVKMDALLDRNPKVRRGGRLAREVYAWVIRQHRLHGGDGRLSSAYLDHDLMADDLMTPRSQVEEGLRRALEVKLLALDGDAVVIVGWSKAWGWGRSAAERQRDSRARKRDASRDVTAERDSEVTGHECHEYQIRSDQISDRAREDSHSLPTAESEQPVDRFGPKQSDRATVVDLASALRKVFPEGS